MASVLQPICDSDAHNYYVTALACVLAFCASREVLNNACLDISWHSELARSYDENCVYLLREVEINTLQLVQKYERRNLY